MISRWRCARVALRAPSSNAIAFVIQSFIDELAHAAGKDPVQFRRDLLPRPSLLRRLLRRFRRWQRLQRGPHAGRAGPGRREVGLGQEDLPKGTAMGVGFHFSHSGYFAEVAEVTVNAKKKVKVNKVWVAADIGSTIINPSRRDEHGAGRHHRRNERDDGAGDHGRSRPRGAEHNFDQHRCSALPRLRPDIEIHYVKSENPPTGMGEPSCRRFCRRLPMRSSRQRAIASGRCLSRTRASVSLKPRSKLFPWKGCMKVHPFFFCFAVCAFAQDSALQALRTTLVALRPLQDKNPDTRDATAQLTVAKHQFRDWVESRLVRFSASDNERALLAGLHEGLRDAKLFCEDECNPSYLGYVDDVQIHREREFLVVQTSVGIRCGYDESAYLYNWSGSAWKRFFTVEQDVYTKQSYKPQTIHSLQISEPDAAGSRLALGLGSRPGCASGFEPVYYRVWRIAKGGTAQLLLDESKFANVGEEPPIRGSVTANEVTVKFVLGGTEWGFPWRATRHYSIEGQRLIQTGPTVVTPRDFVEEWLDAPVSKGALEVWQRRLHRTNGAGDFPDPPLQCPGSPDLWQISTRLTRDPLKTLFLVRWKEPYQFQMVQVSQGTESLCPKQ